MLARFNEQLGTIFELLRKAENIKLAPELLEPEPMKSPSEEAEEAAQAQARGGTWSGEATRSTGTDDTRVDVSIGDEAAAKPAQERKERPLWMTESTVGEYEGTGQSTTSNAVAADVSTGDKSSREDIMSVLLTFEKKEPGANKSMVPEADSDDEGVMSSAFGVNGSQRQTAMEMDDGDVGVMDSDDDDDHVTLVNVGAQKIPINEITEAEISRMTPSEKETYIQQYQDMYSHMYD
jgi:transcription initiation factor TFIIE subunit alpha